MSSESRPPKVTAIIIVYNGAEFLDEAIGSIRSQSFGDWELVVVDDGSTDASQAIAGKHASQDPGRIRVIHHPAHANRGMSASRNLGIAQARGEYIAFLDADDIWLPDKLYQQTAILDDRPSVDLLYGRTLIWHSWETGNGHDDYFYPLGVEVGRSYAPTLLLPTLLRGQAQTPTTCNAIMRSSLVRAVGGFENRFRGMFEDQAFFSKALLVGNCYVSDVLWARYRQHSGSTTSQSFSARQDDVARARFLIWFGAYVVARTGPFGRLQMLVASELMVALRRHWGRTVRRVWKRA